MTGRCKWTRTLFTLVLLAVFLCTGTLLAGRGGNKPPKDPPPTPDISYSITLLDTLGGASSGGDAMNELGDVVGYSAIAGTPKPFVYRRNTGEIVNLYDLFTQEDRDRWISWWPYGINSLGQICGSAYKAGDANEFAVRFTPEDTDNSGNVVLAHVDILAPASIRSNAADINEFGDVTGWYIDGNGSWRAFVYTDEDGLEDIGDLGSGGAVGAAINNSGQVTGYSDNADGKTRAFRFTPGTGMVDLGIIKKGGPDIWGDNSSGNDINDSGVVIGQSSAGARKGWSRVNVFREAGQGMEDLGTLGGSRSQAGSVNSHGDIVGWAHDEDNQTVYFLYTDEFGMVELEPLITNLPADTSKIKVSQINDAGEICGTISYTDATEEAFLLTPLPSGD
jgi:probable HAF family extracellular repeat protein